METVVEREAVMEVEGRGLLRAVDASRTPRRVLVGGDVAATRFPAPPVSNRDASRKKSARQRVADHLWVSSNVPVPVRLTAPVRSSAEGTNNPNLNLDTAKSGIRNSAFLPVPSPFLSPQRNGLWRMSDRSRQPLILDSHTKSILRDSFATPCR